jgi:hypothetical protein
MIQFFKTLVFAGGFLSMVCNAQDHLKAPAAFDHQSSKAIFVDFKHVDKQFIYNVASKRAHAKATISCDVIEEGQPILVFRPDIRSLTINQQAVDLKLIAKRKDPDAQTDILVIEQILSPGSHTFEIEYELSKENLIFGSDFVRSAFFVSDLDFTAEGFGLIERSAPTNYEFDRYSQSIHYVIQGTNKTHEIISNGTRTFKGTNEWRYTYPDYFAPGSLYMHLFEDGHFKIKSADYNGLQKVIPITTYASTETLANRGLQNSLKVMKELETTYGPYLHDQAIAYITPSGGGMEHAGATITSLWALEHEFTHFWFARGVMPVDGNAGWIDEAIASWRDNGYLRRDPRKKARIVNLAGYSPYRRSTPVESYSLGEVFMSELDHYFSAQGSGLKQVLAELFGDFAGHSISTQDFQNYIDDRLVADIASRFDRYVYGNDADDTDTVSESISFAPSNLPTITPTPKRASRHPRPFTPSELKELL